MSHWQGLDPHEGRLLVVGGGLATVRLVASLRRKKFTGTITVLTAEHELPYDRPQLSKEVLAGGAEPVRLPFDTDKLAVDLRTGVRATGLHPHGSGGTVTTDSGESFDHDALVVATGASPIRLPGPGRQHTLRTIDDAVRLRSRLTPGTRVVLVGASWIGAEVATAATAAGCEVTCVEAAAEPLAGALGEQVARATRDWWRATTLLTGRQVAGVEDDGVHLADGEVLGADVVVSGIGVRPDLGWLAGSGLATARGILTDARCRTNLPGVLAIGDVAQRWSARSGSHRLTEHWDDANTVAATAAATLLDPVVGPEHDPVPYFWSDQFGRKLQYVGLHSPEDEVTVVLGEDGTLSRARWVRDGVLTAWLGVDATREVVAARTAVGTTAPVAV